MFLFFKNYTLSTAYTMDGLLWLLLECMDSRYGIPGENGNIGLIGQIGDTYTYVCNISIKRGVWGSHPKVLIRDRDRKQGPFLSVATNSGIQ